MREIEQAWDGFCRNIYECGDVDAAMAAAGSSVSLVNIPVGTGGADRDAVRDYLAHSLVPHLPEGLTRTRVSRTVDRFRLVEETRVAFTHDRELPWLLPGLAPTRRRAEVLAITIALFRQGKLASARTLWDHMGLLEQLTPASTKGSEPL